MSLLTWGMGLWGSDPTDGEGAERGQPVLVEPVRMTDASRVFEAIGTARAQKSADLYPNVAETVRAVSVRAEQAVEAGDVLVELDDREEQLALQNAEVARANAAALVRRLEQAAASQAVSARQLEEAQTAHEAAKVAVAQARLALAERQIKAPFAGVVGLIRLDPGDRVTPETLITGLDDRATLLVEFEVPESLQAELQAALTAGATLQATTPAFPGEEFAARLVAQDNRVTPTRRTVLVRAEVPNPDDRLRPGMSFALRWMIPGPPRPTVPDIALQYDNEGAYLWRVTGAEVVRVPVRVALRREGEVLLEGDLAAGQLIVREGVQRLRPGATVRVLNPPTHTPQSREAE